MQLDSDTPLVAYVLILFKNNLPFCFTADVFVKSYRVGLWFLNVLIAQQYLENI